MALREIDQRAADPRALVLLPERIARKFGNDDPDTRQAVEEGTRTIVSEVTQLKRMVDEFSRFARMPAVHMRHAQLAEILRDYLSGPAAPIGPLLFPAARSGGTVELSPGSASSEMIPRAMRSFVICAR